MKKAKILKTGRLTLRPFKKKDASAIYDGWGHHPDISKFLTWNPNESVEDVKKFVSSVLNNSQSRLYNWIITLGDTKKPIGSLAVSKVDYQNMTCEIGYCYAKEYWRKGYATEALKRVIKHLFEERQFKEVKACHHILNTASGKVMKKSGMKYYKTDMVYVPQKDKNFPCHFYSIKNPSLF